MGPQHMTLPPFCRAPLLSDCATYKPINAPASGQTVITQVEATDTLHDAEGAPTDTGTVLAPQSLTITA